MSAQRKQALAKGLGALLGRQVALAEPTLDSVELKPIQSSVEIAPPAKTGLLKLPLNSIRPNPHQPRTHFADEALEELAASIRAHGILQPLLVTAGEDAGNYVLLAGERRLRAAERAGLREVPALLMEATEAEMLELALIENIQRDNLNPVEEARAYRALADSFGHTQEQIAQRTGKSRVAIANALRLLKLSDTALADLEDGRLTAGHARAILMLAHLHQQELLRTEIVTGDLTVRQAEQRARDIQLALPPREKTGSSKAKKNSTQDLDTVAMAERLTERFGCKVRIRARSSSSGVIEIPYHSLDDFDRILDVAGVSTES